MSVTSIQLAPPRFVVGEAFQFAGMQERFHCDARPGIPQLWKRFSLLSGNIPGQVGGETYGVISDCDTTGNFNYMAGTRIEGREPIPAGFQTIALPPQRYVVFSHHGPVSEIYRTACTIWTQWMPGSGYRSTDGPHFERYCADFNPETDVTGVEIWIPISS